MRGAINITVPLLSRSQPLSHPVRQEFSRRSVHLGPTTTASTSAFIAIATDDYYRIYGRYAALWKPITSSNSKPAPDNPQPFDVSKYGGIRLP